MYACLASLMAPIFIGPNGLNMCLRWLFHFSRTEICTEMNKCAYEQTFWYFLFLFVFLFTLVSVCMGHFYIPRFWVSCCNSVCMSWAFVTCDANTYWQSHNCSVFHRVSSSLFCVKCVAFSHIHKWLLSYFLFWFGFLYFLMLWSVSAAGVMWPQRQHSAQDCPEVPSFHLVVNRRPGSVFPDAGRAGRCLGGGGSCWKSQRQQG